MDARSRWGFWRRHSRPSAKAVRMVEYLNLPRWSSIHVVHRRFHVVDVVEEMKFGEADVILPANLVTVLPSSLVLSSCTTTFPAPRHYCTLCENPARSRTTSALRIEYRSGEGRDGMVLGRHCNALEAARASSSPQLRCRSSRKLHLDTAL